MAANGEAKWIWVTGRLQKPVHYAYFRTTFDLPRAAAKATLRCTADSKYRLYVNGVMIGQGPARGHPEHPYVDTHTVALRRGRNTVAFVVAHYTNRTPIFASLEGGLWCEVVVDGDVVARTDGSWKACTSRALRAIPVRSFGFAAIFDARQDPRGWQRPGFDDRLWRRAIVRTRTQLAPPAQFKPRPIPPLTDKPLAPVTVLRAGACTSDKPVGRADSHDISESLWKMELLAPQRGQFTPALDAPTAWPKRPIRVKLPANGAAYIMLDFGLETLAEPVLHARGDKGVIIDVGHSEVLWNNRVHTQWQSMSIKQSERIVLGSDAIKHRWFQPRGFRYVVIRLANPHRRSVTAVLEHVAAHEMVYPTKPRGRFACSDPVLDQVYDLSARTVNLCMEDAYTDCPWRERSQWVGDAQPETLFSYYCFGAYDLARKAVIEFTTGNTDKGWIPGVFPTARPMNLPTWGMRVPVIAWEYVLYSGDRDVLPDAYEGVRKQMAYFARHEDADGLVTGMNAWNFVDWTRADDRHNDGAVQGWYLEALEYSAKLARSAGDKTGFADFTRRAKRLRKSLAKLYWSPKRKAFRKYRPGSDVALPDTDPELIGQHENSLFALLGVGTTVQRRAALDAMRGATGMYLPNLGDYQSAHVPGHGGNYVGEDVIRVNTPFWSYYVLLALLEAGRVSAAVAYMRLCWGMMLEFGATSCWEMWDRHTSLCHGWSAAPAMLLPAYVLGVTPATPGFATFNLRPRLAELTWARGRVPTPQGAIGVSWKRDGATWRCSVDVPRGLRGRFTWDRSNGKAQRITLDGKAAPRTGRIVLAEGQHELVVRLA